MKRSKWLAPLIATTIALSSVASVVPQQAVEAKTTTKKPVYLPTWQGIKVDDLEFFPRKGYIRYSKEKGLEYYMNIYPTNSPSVYTTGLRPINMNKKKMKMIPKMYKSLHTNRFRIQKRTLIGQDKDGLAFFYMKIGEKGMLPNHIDTEIYDLIVNDEKLDEEYKLRCNFSDLSLEHETITKYLQMGRLDYAEEIWKGYEKVYTPDYRAQQTDSLTRMLNVLADMEGFNKEERTQFKKTVFSYANLIFEGTEEGYRESFIFKNHKYSVLVVKKSLGFELTKF